MKIRILLLGCALIGQVAALQVGIGISDVTGPAADVNFVSTDFLKFYFTHFAFHKNVASG